MLHAPIMDSSRTPNRLLATGFPTLADGHACPSIFPVTRIPSTKLPKLMGTLFDGFLQCKTTTSAQARFRINCDDAHTSRHACRDISRLNLIPSTKRPKYLGTFLAPSFAPSRLHVSCLATRHSLALTQEGLLATAFLIDTRDEQKSKLIPIESATSPKIDRYTLAPLQDADTERERREPKDTVPCLSASLLPCLLRMPMLLCPAARQSCEDKPFIQAGESGGSGAAR